MASQDDTVNLDYDEQNDVLYASRGSSQPALSYEIVKDIWLDYVPPDRTVVGMTILNFSNQFAVSERTELLNVAEAIVKDLLRQYPSVPLDERVPEDQMSSIYAPYIWISISTVFDARPNSDTQYIGVGPMVESFRIQSSPIPVGVQAHEGDDVIS
jgi:Protein of unknown function (DUF2283)